jgi:putative flavoprotein involved in K+ transport
MAAHPRHEGRRMIKEQIETIVIGGGQAGLTMSYHLSRLGREHLVLERRRIAERWRSERWDSLMFQSPNWNIRLPGLAFQTNDPDAFASRDDIVGFLEHYAAVIRASVRSGISATSLRRKAGSTRLIVETSAGLIEAKDVVIATGPYHAPVDPLPIAGTTLQLHSSRYRNPGVLPPGAVLVIGSGNSGCQIAEELCHAGRQVYLSVSRHRRAPRRYRGRDLTWWQHALGETDATVEQCPDKPASRLLTGVAGGHDVDLRQLARNGVVLLGRVIGGRGSKLSIAANLREDLAWGDVSSADFLRQADEYAVGNRVDLPPPDRCPQGLPDPKEVSDPILTLDIDAAEISTIIWANGFRYNFDWIDLPIFRKERGAAQIPLHKRGVTGVPGVYFLGLPWLHKFKSAHLNGVGEDAEYLAEQMSRSIPRCSSEPALKTG